MSDRTAVDVILWDIVFYIGFTISAIIMIAAVPLWVGPWAWALWKAKKHTKRDSMPSLTDWEEKNETLRRR